MPEWEAFYFRKFFKNGYLVCISKGHSHIMVTLESQYE